MSWTRESVESPRDIFLDMCEGKFDVFALTGVGITCLLRIISSFLVSEAKVWRMVLFTRYISGRQTLGSYIFSADQE